MSATQRNNSSYNCGNLVWSTESVFVTRTCEDVAVVDPFFASVGPMCDLDADGNTGKSVSSKVEASTIFVRASSSSAVRLEQVVVVALEPSRHDRNTVDERGTLNGQQSNRCLSKA